MSRFDQLWGIACCAVEKLSAGQAAAAGGAGAGAGISIATVLSVDPAAWTPCCKTRP